TSNRLPTCARRWCRLASAAVFSPRLYNCRRGLWTSTGTTVYPAKSCTCVERHRRTRWRYENASTQRTRGGTDLNLPYGPDRSGPRRSYVATVANHEPWFRYAERTHDVVRSRFA